MRTRRALAAALLTAAAAVTSLAVGGGVANAGVIVHEAPDALGIIVEDLRTEPPPETPGVLQQSDAAVPDEPPPGDPR